MFFDNPADIIKIAGYTPCSVFVLPHPEGIAPNTPNTHLLTLEKNKKSIGIEEVRAFTAGATAKQSSAQFFIITPADALTEQAQNALLKELEEPKEHYHYILITKSPTLLLPTIRSRSQIYYQRQENSLTQPISAEPKIAELARELIKAHPAELPALADKIAKTKDQPRILALNVAATAIEILEKSYFKTRQSVYLKKLQKFIALESALSQNGHVKLHIVADLC